MGEPPSRTRTTHTHHRTRTQEGARTRRKSLVLKTLSTSSERRFSFSASTRMLEHFSIDIFTVSRAANTSRELSAFPSI